jgi:hypothetical protein
MNRRQLSGLDNFHPRPSRSKALTTKLFERLP